MTKEYERLAKLWAYGKATPAQIKRCMELDRAAKAEESNAD